MNPPPLSLPENPFGDPTQARQERQAAIRRGVFLGCGGCASLALLVLLFIAGIAYFIFASVKKTDPFQLTLQAAQASPAMQARLGEPITLGFWFTGSFNSDNGHGSADVHITLKGPKGSVTVHTIGTQAPSAPWVFTRMHTTTPPEINLLPP
jgi:hypothetical protein